MSPSKASRRQFLQTSAATAAAVSVPYFFHNSPVIGQDAKTRSPNDRPIIGCIGVGDRWNAVGPQALNFGDCVAVCDVDSAMTDKAKARVKEGVGTTPRPTRPKKKKAAKPAEEPPVTEAPAEEAPVMGTPVMETLAVETSIPEEPAPVQAESAPAPDKSEQPVPEKATKEKKKKRSNQPPAQLLFDGL